MIDIKKFLKGLRILNVADQTKSVEISVSNSATTNTKLTIASKQDKNVTLELPNTPIGVTTDELLSAQSTQTVTNKTLTSPVINTPDMNGGTVDGAAINDSPIGQTTPAAIAATSLTATSASVSGDTVTTNTATQTLTNKTLTTPTVNTPTISNGSITGTSIDNSVIGAVTPTSATFTTVNATTVNVGGSALVTVDGTQTLTNKTLVDNSTIVVDSVDNTKQIKFDASGSTSTSTTLQSSQTADRTLTLPDITDTLVSRTNTESLSNKSLIDSSTAIVDSVDSTKQIKFNASGTTGTSTTLVGSQTSNIDITLPDATTTLLGNDNTATVTNKTISGSNNTLSNISLTASVTGTLPIANGGTNNGALAVTAGGVLYTDGTKVVNVGAGTSGQILQSNGSSAPSWVTNTLSSAIIRDVDISGPYQADTGVYYLYVIDACTLSDVTMVRVTAGTSGSTTLDIQLSTAGGAFSTVFSTKPSIAFNAGNVAYRSKNNGSSNTTAPVFSTTAIPANSILRVDINAIEAGDPADLRVSIKLN